MAYIIAEIGVNHNGNVDNARKLIDAAKVSGADAVKFQVFSAEILEPPGERRKMLEGLELSRAALRSLKTYADDADIEFIATPFDINELEFLVDLGVETIKIGSGEMKCRGLIAIAITRAKTVIVSTGMANMAEISDMWDNIAPAYPVLMHCTSAYPCPVEDVNLEAMVAIRNRFHTKTGFSDHTTSTVIPAAAVAMGATYIEKHLTLHRGLPGPDHLTSLEPDKFREMVQNIREVEKALGDGIKRPMLSEKAVMKIRKEREEWRAQ